MATELGEFLIALANDPEGQARFTEDPEPFVAGTDLSEEPKRALIEGDQEKIQELVGPGYKIEGVISNSTVSVAKIRDD